MAAVLRWLLRLFSLLAMVLFAALLVVFVIVTVDQFGQQQYVTDSVAGLPPVYVITALLVPFCAAFVVGFWMLFMDTFRQPEAEEQFEPVPFAGTAREPLPERVVRWARARRPRWPGRAG